MYNEIDMSEEGIEKEISSQEIKLSEDDKERVSSIFKTSRSLIEEFGKPLSEELPLKKVTLKVKDPTDFRGFTPVNILELQKDDEVVIRYNEYYRGGEIYHTEVHLTPDRVTQFSPQIEPREEGFTDIRPDTFHKLNLSKIQKLLAEGEVVEDLGEPLTVKDKEPIIPHLGSTVLTRGKRHR